MSRWDQNLPLSLPWSLKREDRGPGGGYRIKGSCGLSLGIYCARSDVDLIIEAVNSYEKLKAENARFREALEFYADPLRPDEELNYDMGLYDDELEPGHIAREALKSTES